MKKLLLIIPVFMVMSSCSSTKEAKSSRLELRKEKNIVEQAVVRKAVESRRFIIKFDKMYFSRAGMIDLVPRANYIIIDRDKAIISTAYLGRQYDIRPIAGINIQGEPKDYELTSNLSRGMYKIKMKVDNGSNSFDLYLNIGSDGSCSASLTNIRIDFVRYRGYLVPIKDQPAVPLQKGDVI